MLICSVDKDVEVSVQQDIIVQMHVWCSKFHDRFLVQIYIYPYLNASHQKLLKMDIIGVNGAVVNVSTSHASGP